MHGKLATITSTKESELERSESSESIANTVPGLREDSIRPNRHGKVTRRATASVCLQCALRRLEQRERRRLSHMTLAKRRHGYLPVVGLSRRAGCCVRGGFSPCFPPDAPRALGFHTRHLTIVSGDSRRLAVTVL